MNVLVMLESSYKKKKKTEQDNCIERERDTDKADIMSNQRK